MSRVRAVAVLEIVGGVTGLAFTLVLPEIYTEPRVLVPYVGAFTLTVAAGVLLWLRRSAGRPLSVVVQLLQVPQVVLAGWGLQFYAGLLAGIVFLDTTTPSVLLAGLGAGFLLYTGESPGSYQVGVNVAPLVVLFLLKPRPGKRPQVSRDPLGSVSAGHP